MFDLDIRSWLHKHKHYPSGEGTWIFGVSVGSFFTQQEVYVGRGTFDEAYRALINHLVSTQVSRAVILLADWEVHHVAN